jgi:uncharacterized membrane protein
MGDASLGTAGDCDLADEVGWVSESSHHGAFGNDRFGVLAERFARFFGTPRFIVGQTVLVAIWIALNAVAVSLRWDPYPFILLNLAFSTQAAYAAPLILLAQTRQADRDKMRDAAVQAHREKEAAKQEAFEKHETEVLAREQEMAENLARMLERNTAVTEQVAKLTEELHISICKP